MPWYAQIPESMFRSVQNSYWSFHHHGFSSGFQETGLCVIPNKKGHMSSPIFIINQHLSRISDIIVYPKTMNGQKPQKTIHWSCIICIDGQFSTLCWLNHHSSTGFHGCPGSGFETFGAASTGHQLAKPQVSGHRIDRSMMGSPGFPAVRPKATGCRALASHGALQRD